MKSNTKNLLTEDQITNLVKVNFGDSFKVGNITELKGGMFNSAYLIERQDQKDEMVLKVSLQPGTKTLTYEKDPMPTEVAVYKMVEEKTTIPTPHVITYDFSKKQIPSNYFFMTALKGVTLQKTMKKISKENMDELKVELAGYFAQLHQLKGNYYGYFTEDKKYQFKTWKDAFGYMMGNILKDGKVHGIKLPYDRIEKVLQDKLKYLDVIKEPSLIDYDLWPGNVFVIQKGNNYVIEGIIDFERAYWGDPLADFPPAFIIMNELQIDENFWHTYKEKSNFGRELTKEDEIRLAFYSLYIFLIMMVETFRYNFIYGKLQSAYAKKNVLKYLELLEKA